MEYVDDDLIIRPIPEIDEMLFYKDDTGQIRYNEKCEKCPKRCKQSFRISRLICSMAEKEKKK